MELGFPIIHRSSFRAYFEQREEALHGDQIAHFNTKNWQGYTFLGKKMQILKIMEP